jgi:hypothetical protein
VGYHYDGNTHSHFFFHQDLGRQKAEAEGRLRLADTQAMELANSVQLKDSEIQVFLIKNHMLEYQF